MTLARTPKGFTGENAPALAPCTITRPMARVLIPKRAPRARATGATIAIAAGVNAPAQWRAAVSRNISTGTRIFRRPASRSAQ